MLQGEFRDPRLVPVYDAECPWTREDDYFAAVAAETPGARVLDLGCGTGRLALGLAAAGHAVTGVDPAAASIAAARVRSGAAKVNWLVGTSTGLPGTAFDLALMTSHVAQFLVADDQWRRTLADLRRALVPGGRLLFDSRDPADRRWERWNPAETHRRTALPDGRVVTAWTEVTSVRGALVDFTHHYVFPDHGELLSTATLRFRPEEELRADLAAAGLTVERVHGGWGGEPVGAGDGEFLVLARRA
ncbi:class I SAM-dependent methyltransferase [Kitasatospora sp. NPDC096147]|uniref:class I SAM-dependent methyltransferase n=1 Tax=Kitasatospora sp. NPDC096147 TaxID=3364093 RepID=UPI0037FAAD8D